jgi:hypothetical protein
VNTDFNASSISSTSFVLLIFACYANWSTFSPAISNRCRFRRFFALLQGNCSPRAKAHPEFLHATRFFAVEFGTSSQLAKKLRITIRDKTLYITQRREELDVFREATAVIGRHLQGEACHQCGRVEELIAHSIEIG